MTDEQFIFKAVRWAGNVPDRPEETALPDSMKREFESRKMKVPSGSGNLLDLYWTGLTKEEISDGRNRVSL